MMRIYPKNRHILVEPIVEEVEGTQVIVPDDYRAPKDHVIAKVLKVHESVKDEVTEGSLVVVEPNMLREVSLFGQTHYLLQANYILCEVIE